MGQRRRLHLQPSFQGSSTARAALQHRSWAQEWLTSPAAPDHVGCCTLQLRAKLFLCRHCAAIKACTLGQCLQGVSRDTPYPLLCANVSASAAGCGHHGQAGPAAAAAAPRGAIGFSAAPSGAVEAAQCCGRTHG